MKRLILIAGLFVLAACGTVNRVTQKTEVSRDSTAHVKTDSLKVVKRDSTGHKEDHSLITTTEHIVNDITTPGDTLAAMATLGDLLKSAQIITSTDSSERVVLTYDKADSSFKATVYQKPKTQHQVIDRTTQDQVNTTEDSKVNSKDSTSLLRDSYIKTHVDSLKKTTDKTITGAAIPWYIWASICTFVALASGIAIFYFLRKK